MRIAFQTLRRGPRAMTQGKGASRRLRHSGKVPAILYGAHEGAARAGARSAEPADHDRATSASIPRSCSIKVGEQTQEAIVKDVQMHPAQATSWCTSICSASSRTRRSACTLPIHFKGEASSPGVKTQGGVVSHMRADVEVSLPAEGSAGVPRAGPVGHEPERHQVPVGHAVAAGRDDPGAGAAATPPVVSIHAPRAEEPEPTAEAAAAPAEGACRLRRCAWRGSRCSGRRCRGAAAAARRRRRAMPRRATTRRLPLRPRRKAARSSRGHQSDAPAVAPSARGGRRRRFRCEDTTWPASLSS